MNARLSESVPEFDLYATLGVARDAPAEVIVSAHRSLIRRVHPDLSSDPRSQEHARRLNVARDWLIDPHRRALFDRTDRQGQVIPVAHRPTVGPARPRDWERSRERGGLEAFIARCRYLTRDEVARLLAARTRLGTMADVSAARALALSRELGRQSTVTESTRVAVAARAARRRGTDPALSEILGWTALGFAVVDVAPRDATILLAPWREVTDRIARRDRSALAWARRVRRSVGSVAVTGFLAASLGLALIGFLVVAGVVFGQIAG